MRKALRSPAVVLLLLSPMVAELLSASNPPLAFFFPPSFIFLVVLYGGGANIVRELTHRWGMGWPTVFVLGVAYAIVEEGLGLKAFFDPGQFGIPALRTYGRFAGVESVTTLWLFLYHSIVSIGIPILLVELMFPDRRSQSWLSKRAFNTLGLLLPADVAFGYFVVNPYKPPPVPFLLAVVVMVGLYALAPRMPRSLFVPGRYKVTRARWFGLVGFVAAVMFFLILAETFPNAGVPPLVTAVSLVALPIALIGVVRRMGAGSWSDIHRLALAAGVLAVLVLLTPLQELGGALGMSVVGLAAAVFLVRLIVRTRCLGEQRTKAAGAGD